MTPVVDACPGADECGHSSKTLGATRVSTYAPGMTDVVSVPLQVDRQRRTTIPSAVLAATGIPAGASLVARADGPGRIVLESPQLMLARLQERIAAGAAALAEREGGPRPLSMAEELLAERAAEAAAEAGTEAGIEAGTEQPGENERITTPRGEASAAAATA